MNVMARYRVEFSKASMRPGSYTADNALEAAGVVRDALELGFYVEVFRESHGGWCKVPDVFVSELGDDNKEVFDGR